MSRRKANPLSSGGKLAVGAGIAAVVGVLGYVIYSKEKTAAAATTPRTANALDNYTLTITSPTAIPAASAVSVTQMLQTVGISTATVGTVSQSADGKSITAQLTAPPGLSIPSGGGYVLVDTGINTP